MTAPVAYPWEAPATGSAAALSARLAADLPRLETARLVLRAPRIGDFETYADILMSDRAKHMDGPFDRQSAWLDFSQYVAGWLLRGAGMWAIEDRAGGQVLGFVSIGMEFGDREHELGYLLTEAAEGRGLATEAAEAARDFALGPQALPSLVSYVDPDNAASARVAERLCAQRDLQAEAGFDEPVLVFRHLPGDEDGGMEAYA